MKNPEHESVREFESVKRLYDTNTLAITALKPVEELRLQITETCNFLHSRNLNLKLTDYGRARHSDFKVSTLSC
ncbi:unnamed protein product [Trichobilharzia szidati]|nr:unnamed protein product [Trichobilharzia szidati]